MGLNLTTIRADFPILSRKVNGQDLVYLDNAATSQTPTQVIDVIADYYQSYNANIHRGVHTLSQEATDKFEQARQSIQNHFNIRKSHEVIFTSGTTHSINLVAFGFGTILDPGDEVIVSALEHHANIVPWQMMCDRSGAILRVIPMTDDGTLDMHAYKELLNKKTKLVFVNHVSNALGTINPIKEIIDNAHKVGELFGGIMKKFVFIASNCIKTNGVHIVYCFTKGNSTTDIRGTCFKLMRQIRIGGFLEGNFVDHFPTTLVGRQLIEPFFFTIKHANTRWSTEFMCRSGVEIDVEFFEVGFDMPTGLCTID